MVDYELEVICGKGAFPNGSNASHPHAALKSATYEGRVLSLLDSREVGFELLRDAR